MFNAISQLFGGQQSQAPASAPQANPNAPTGVANPGQALPGTQQSSQTAANGVVPNQPAEPVSPLQSFADVWQTAPNAAETNEPMFKGFDQARAMESVKKVDFTKQLTPELLQQVQAGGQEAITALMQSLNSVAQTTAAYNAVATTKIVEQALAKQAEQYDAKLPNLVKKFSANESILASNPLLANPAVQPLVSALQEQLVRKNPNATSAEIQMQVADYFSALGQTFGTNPQESAKTAKPSKSEDWSTFFS